jgi:transcriptional regulator
MAAKKLSVVNSQIGTNGRRVHLTRLGSDHHYSGPTLTEATFRKFGLTHHGGSAQHPRQLPRRDYAIVLVRIGRRTPRSASSTQSTRNYALLLPHTWRELLGRLRRITASSNLSERTMVLQFGEVSVNFRSMEINRSGKPIELKAQEFRLLQFFSRFPNQVISREELLHQVWNYTSYPATRTVDNHVWMLRRKLELNPARPVHFLTIRGLGYKFIP